jgi:GNAT superfamily N-acetyltransferase
MKTYSQFIIESQEVLNKITKNWERSHPGMKAHATISQQGDIRLHSLEVPKDQRGKGIGGRFMKGLTNVADKQKRRVTLSQQAEPGYKKKLDTFYKRFNFKSNKGRNKDFSVSDTMIRNPNP